jgi:hypothetical protein
MDGWTDGWIQTVSFLPIPKMDEKCLLDFFHSQHGCKLSGFCIFQPDHVPDPWMNTVCFASSNPTMFPNVDENCPFCFIQPDHLGRPQQRLQQRLARSLARFLLSFLGGKALGIRKGGFRNRDSGIQKEREIDAERLMLLVGLFLFSSGIVVKLLDYVKSFIVTNRSKKKKKDKKAAEEEEEEEGKRRRDCSCYIDSPNDCCCCCIAQGIVVVG